ncbi:hypothetical protein D3C78_1463840 [compost metagenome]
MRGSLCPAQCLVEFGLHGLCRLTRACLHETCHSFLAGRQGGIQDALSLFLCVIPPLVGNPFQLAFELFKLFLLSLGTLG